MTNWYFTTLAIIKNANNKSCASEATEFGTDNCATHHICLLLNIFTDMGPAPKIGVTGVVGSLMASGIGTIECVLKGDGGMKQKIKLENVIYLPESAKNLISTTEWSHDKGDDCGYSLMDNTQHFYGIMIKTESILYIHQIVQYP